MAEEIIAKVGVDTGDSEKKLEDVKEGIEDVGKAAEDTAKAAPKAAKGVQKIGASFGSLVKATGIVMVISKVFEFLSEALQRNQKIADAIAIVFDTISNVFNQVVNVLVSVYESVSANNENFDALGKVIKGIMTIAIAPFQLAFYGLKLGIQEAVLAWEKSILGSGDTKKIKKLEKGIKETTASIVEIKDNVVDAGKSIVDNFGEAVTETVNITKQITKGIGEIDVQQAIQTAKTNRRLENTAALAKVQMQGLIEENDRLAEKQRQIRDNENATIQERLDANKKLGEILDKQEKDMLALADLQIAAAQADLKELDNQENRIKLQEAINEKKGVEAQITGFRSEQLTNQVSLEKELLDIKNQIAAESISGLEKELLETEQHYDELIKLAIKAGEDTEDIERQKEEKLKEIRDKAREEERDAVYEQMQSTLDIASQMASSISNITAQREANELQSIENKFAGELKAAEGNAELTAQIEGRKQMEMEKIKKQFAGAKKRGAIAEALINTFQSATKSLADFGFPIGAIFAALAITQGMLQVKNIQNTPAFAQGGIVGGFGTGNSDSTTAKLSKGESVINAKSTRMFKPLLSTINEAGGGRAFAGNDGSGGNTSGVVKAFVVADDMTNEQDKLTKIRRKATI